MDERLSAEDLDDLVMIVEALASSEHSARLWALAEKLEALRPILTQRLEPCWICRHAT